MEFDLKGKEYIELNKLLKLMNLVESGGMAKMVIDEGLVMVNGEIEQRIRNKIKSGFKVEFEGQTVLVK
ncbi:MAG: RNA-binding S4 domain-containing protein [Salibacteraceae bacterium]